MILFLIFYFIILGVKVNIITGKGLPSVPNIGGKKVMHVIPPLLHNSWRQGDKVSIVSGKHLSSVPDIGGQKVTHVVTLGPPDIATNRIKANFLTQIVSSTLRLQRGINTSCFCFLIRRISSGSFSQFKKRFFFLASQKKG